MPLTDSYSRPLARSEVPNSLQLTAAVLRALYMDGGTGDCADKYWFFRPWCESKPKESRVYVRQQSNGKIGFAYFDTTIGSWLMTQRTREDAELNSQAYLREPLPCRQAAIYLSHYQNSTWSAAPLEGVTDLEFDDDAAEGTAMSLALLRWATDPQRKRRGAG
jgi:hypothetical protein